MSECDEIRSVKIFDYLTFSLDLHHEIEDLRAKLVRSNARIAQIECDMADSQKLANFEMAKLTEETIRQKDRCERY